MNPPVDPKRSHRETADTALAGGRPQLHQDHFSLGARFIESRGQEASTVAPVPLTDVLWTVQMT